jgi:lambda family phage portal protein
VFQWLRRWTRSAKAVRRPLAGDGPPRPIRARYDAAITNEDNRRHWANADGLSANAANAPEIRRLLRNRSRYEIGANCYAKGMILRMARTIVGTGPKLQVLLDDDNANRIVERSFKQWAKSINLAQKLRTMVAGKVGDGESVGLFTTNPMLPTPVKLDLSIMEADRLTTPNFGLTANAVDGIEFDAFGNPAWYHILKQHPGDLFQSSAFQFDRIAASQVIHWFRQDRAGQARGIPETTPALPLFAELRRYTGATLGAAETAADFAALLYTDMPPEQQAEAAEPFESIEIERRMLTTVPAGWKMAQLQAEQPTTNHDMFVKSILREIARCLDLSYAIVAGDYSGHNYSSGRLEYQNHSNTIRVEREELQTILDRIFTAWLAEASRIPGLLPFGFGAVSWGWQWLWDGMPHVDPLKEANAQTTRLSNGTTTLAVECAQQGLYWQDVLQQRGKEIALMQQLGIPLPQPTTAGAGPANLQPMTDETEALEEEVVE